jgi:ABC-type methionine transport system permease subunit
MTVEIFLSLLAFFSVVTSLFTEAVKKLLDSINITYASNVVVLLVAALVGGGGTAIFYVWNCYQWTTMHIICIFLMVCANWLCSMVGYDKVIQAVTQAKNSK